MSKLQTVRMLMELFVKGVDIHFTEEGIKLLSEMNLTDDEIMEMEKAASA